MRLKKICVMAALLISAGVLAGCASGARSTAMVAPLQAQTIVSESNPVRGAVAVGQVTGGEETNPMWTSEVSNTAFRQALETSLDLATIKSNAPNAPLTVDAALVSLDQPLVGFNITVTSTVNYQVKTSAGAPVWSTSITAPYTANFSDAFAGYERLRLANEGSIKANISNFIQQLVAESERTPEMFRPGG